MARNPKRAVLYVNAVTLTLNFAKECDQCTNDAYRGDQLEQLQSNQHSISNLCYKMTCIRKINVTCATYDIHKDPYEKNGEMGNEMCDKT